MGLMKDQYGLVRAGTDGGDSCHRTFSVLLLCRLLWKANLDNGAIYENALTVTPGNAKHKLEPQPGLYIRSPDPDWTSGLRTCSRDQLTPVICFLAVMANSKHPELRKAYRKDLTNLLVACLKRGMFAQNNFGHNGEDPTTAKWKMPDFINFELWAVFASGYMRTVFAPIAIVFLLFGDAFKILAVLFFCFAPINKDGTLQFRQPGPDDVDDMNINNVILARKHAFPTPLSYLARKIYKKYRGQNYGNTVLNETSSIMGALAWYNRNDNTDITELYRLLVEKY